MKEIDAHLLENYTILRKISEKEIRQTVKTIAQDLTNDYRDREPVLIGVLNGVFIFFADLVREISFPHEIDFVRLASYGSRDTSSGTAALTKDIELSLSGRPVIIVEDIIDTGLTLSYLVGHIEEKGPESVKICTLINKLERREKAVHIDYEGFEIDRGFVVGYGLDYNEKFRNLPYILSLEL
ncbi:MAG: hypoxanthine phosphoribosyltransferase [Deltaproteobacteria bacterium]|nr:hypoxanthine phosphoribosyltransferase [Deltaproteobacteria bacterium]MBW2077412.1 hypoxanthine phosphoribosyltransferase [Deltaproteobacteria bacterium]MBW2311370.1 hypoxanthine phosphoribosyltransferase [Deltaproteobacteria bacterium]